MKLGNDIWLWLKFAIELIKIIMSIFGDDDDKKTAKENGIKL